MDAGVAGDGATGVALPLAHRPAVAPRSSSHVVSLLTDASSIAPLSHRFVAEWLAERAAAAAQEAASRAAAALAVVGVEGPVVMA